MTVKNEKQQLKGNKMNPDQALNLIVAYLPLLPVPLADHHRCQAAVSVLAEALKPKQETPVEPEKAAKNGNPKAD